MTDLAPAIRATEAAGGSLVSRAAHGLSWITLDAGDLARRATDIRDALQPRPVVLLDGPAGPARATSTPGGPSTPARWRSCAASRSASTPTASSAPAPIVGGI